MNKFSLLVTLVHHGVVEYTKLHHGMPDNVRTHRVMHLTGPNMTMH